MSPRPALPLPPPITGARPGTWAHDTITRRLPEIARRTIQNNEFSSEVTGRIESLIAEIPSGPILRFEEADVTDHGLWNDLLAPHLGRDWLTIPWLIAEFYFYRRLLQATEFHANGQDPFAVEKAAGLHESDGAIDALATRLETLLDRADSATALRELLERSLWGNQADLSLWRAGGEGAGAHAESDRAAHTLVDDLDPATRTLSDPGGTVALLADNAAFEFVSDLALVDYLLTTGHASRVDLLLKPHPMFVSDATIADLNDTIQYLVASPSPATRALGERLNSALERGTLRPAAFDFWGLPTATWQMPTSLRDALAACSLIVSKGDLHYRRLLGDREWPYTTAFDRIVSYMPAPLLALRTLKSELAAGLTEPAMARAVEQDPRWLTDGRWAVAQLSN